MLNVLETSKFIVENSELVNISQDGIDKLCESIHEEDLNVTESGWTHYQWPYEELVPLLFIFDAVNFCFWAGKDQPKWAVDIGGKTMDGSMALLWCIEEEMGKNPELIKPAGLANLSEAE